MQNLIIKFILENYIIISIIFSVFVGFYARFYFKINNKAVHSLYDFWIGFSGSAIGWLALYSFINSLQNSGHSLSFADITLLLISIIGIVGFLPRLLLNILDGVTTFISKKINQS